MAESEYQSKSIQNRRRIFPSNATFCYFVLYLMATVIILYLLYQFSRISRSFGNQIGFQWINTLCLFGLGICLFFLVRHYVELKFYQFLTRLDYDFGASIWHDHEYIRFRKSIFTPWAIQELNTILQQASIPIRQTSETLAQLAQEIEDEYQTTGLNREKLLSHLESMERKLNQSLNREAATEHTTRPPGIYNLFTLKSTTIWAGFYGAIFLILWFCLPFWMASEIQVYNFQDFLFRSILWNGFIVFALLIGATSYLWTSYRHLQFIRMINVCCEEYLHTRNVNAFKTDSRHRYGFFLTTLRLHVFHNEDQRSEILRRIADVKDLLLNNDKTLKYKDLKRLTQLNADRTAA